MNTLIIFCAEYLLLASAIIWVVCWFRQIPGRKLNFVLVTLAAAVVAYGLAKLGGHFISDPRPFVSDNITPLIAHTSDNGFPSDHTLLAALLGFMVLARHRTLGIAALLVALAIGASRVAAGVHHPLDIFGSFVISAFAVYAVLSVEKLIVHRKPAAQ